ncbi:DUF305 domain-containing protein [Rhizobium sp. SSA_523]|uniref:CopM family metallochaperone n=1 Tax=Rhizobium sp. SSA_523 TaxID=2952477 RepID=UPI002090BEA6|nr:DUF305 domain-containing protein [Rhizobium sp. SSA_523]MCO5733169.1 DUF305 domain-containing protein [Rhizobium sp. SSA_523]WKC24039.1 DUF305 domain-containing protein [Rhizobium sp. SSA_523]
MTAKTLSAAFLAASLLALPATAQDSSAPKAMPGGSHAMHGAQANTTASPSTQAFEAANKKMHADMAIAYSGNPDVDFVRSMIPHHQGAIDMAKIELAHGKDPELRKLAQEVISAQEGEIAMMRAWLAEHGQ